MLAALYCWFAHHSVGASLNRTRASVVAGSLAKLGVAGCTEARALGAEGAHIVRTWRWLSSQESMTSTDRTTLSTSCLLILGLSHAIAGAAGAPATFQREVSAAACKELCAVAKLLSSKQRMACSSGGREESAAMPFACKEELALPAENDDSVNASQLLTGLQCLVFFGGKLSGHGQHQLNALVGLLPMIELPLTQRRLSLRRDGTMAPEVLDTLEDLLVTCGPSALPPSPGPPSHSILTALPPRLEVEVSVAQFFVDVVLSPEACSWASAATGREQH